MYSFISRTKMTLNYHKDHVLVNFPDIDIQVTIRSLVKIYSYFDIENYVHTLHYIDQHKSSFCVLMKSFSCKQT